MASAFGGVIREWRGVRRLSQLQLSLEAGTSARHLSFLESGRAKPSRSMVLKLADALNMPKQAANQALHVAGYAPAFPALAPDDRALAPVREAVSFLLKSHSPFPAVAIDRRWNLIGANDSALALFAAIGAGEQINMLEALLFVSDADTIENWEENALLVLSRLKSEIAHYGGDEELEALASRFASHPRLLAYDRPVDYSQAVVPTIICLGDLRLSLFSTLAHFGSVQDVTASEIRIELMLPADEATRRYFISQVL